MISAIRKFISDRRGAFALQFALIVTPLVGCTGLAIDGGRVFLARFELASALDAAALAVGSTVNPDADLDALAQLYVDRNFKTATMSPVRVTLVPGAEIIIVRGNVDVATYFMPLFGMPMVNVSAESEVRRGGADVEVALVLDTTYSMNGAPMTALKAAAADLIDIVVSENQEPYFSKAAIVPYSNGMFVGDKAVDFRGAITAGKPITGAQWRTSNVGINGITRASQAVVTTASNHGLSNGDIIHIGGVKGMTQINDKVYSVEVVNNTSFKLRNAANTSYINTNSGYSNYQTSSTDFVSKCLLTTCEVQITSNGHGFSNNQYVSFLNVGGMTGLNYSATSGAASQSFQVTSATTNTFRLKDTMGLSYANYTNNTGNVYCTTEGCEFFRFAAVSGNYTARISQCVTERTGANAYTDAAPEDGLLGRHYAGTSYISCFNNGQIMPLTADRSALTTRINSLGVNGSTAGHIGLAWGWYMLSEAWADVWNEEEENIPQPYTSEDLVKVIVMMTDGEFNVAYNKGVTSKNYDGFGANNQRINANATNGSPFDQAEDLCDAIKAKKIVIYTVGFNLDENGDAADTLSYCASQPSYAHLASTPEELSAAFQSIATSITLLRLSR